MVTFYDPKRTFVNRPGKGPRPATPETDKFYAEDQNDITDALASGTAGIFPGRIRVPSISGTAFTAPTDINQTASAITITQAFHRVQSNSAPNEIDNINGGTKGEFLLLKKFPGATSFTVKDGTGNLDLLAGDFLINDNKHMLKLFYDGDKWFEISRNVIGAGSGFVRDAFDDSAQTFTGWSVSPIDLVSPAFNPGSQLVLSSSGGVAGVYMEAMGYVQGDSVGVLDLTLRIHNPSHTLLSLFLVTITNVSPTGARVPFHLIGHDPSPDTSSTGYHLNVTGSASNTIFVQETRLIKILS